MKQTTTQFEFTAKPKVTAVKAKYRQREQERLDGTNLMNDPRIVRGNTYAAIVANRNQIQPPPIPKKTQKESKKQTNTARRINFDTGFEPTTPRAIDGRSHFTTQTQPFVETLRNRPIQYQKQSQTDLFLDRPVERAFNPLAEKIGVDCHTQVDQNDPQLFNFDYQVQPILQALLNKVLETSRMQLHQEQQMRDKQRQKIDYQKRRHTLLAEAQKLQSNQNRLVEEYQRRQLQFRVEKDQQIFTQKKVISRILSKQYLKNLQGNTEQVLNHEGFFRHPFEIDIYQEFLPWLYNEIHGQLEEKYRYEEFMKEIIESSERQKLMEAEANINKEKQRRRERYEAKQRKKQEKIEKKQAEKAKKLEQEEEERRKSEEEAKQNQNKEEQPPVA